MVYLVIGLPGGPAFSQLGRKAVTVDKGTGVQFLKDGLVYDVLVSHQQQNC